MLNDVFKVNSEAKIRIQVFSLQIMYSFPYRTQGAMSNVYCKDKINVEKLSVSNNGRTFPSQVPPLTFFIINSLFHFSSLFKTHFLPLFLPSDITFILYLFSFSNLSANMLKLCRNHLIIQKFDL